MVDSFKKNLATLMKKFMMDIVVYDESEKFLNYKSPFFNYPYEKRKNLITRIRYRDDFPMNFLGKFEYEYVNTKLEFMRSQVCLNN